MRNFLKSTGFKVLLAVLTVLLAGVAVAATVSSRSSPLTSAAGVVFAPLQRVTSFVTQRLQNVTGGFISAGAYKERVEELEREVADYQSKLVDYEKLKRQVETYEKFLEVKEKNPDFKFVTGAVIGRDAADLFHSFTLNCGSTDGVAVNDPVIHGEYLVGIVSEVQPTSCTVLTILDPRVNAAAYEIRTNEMGYAKTDTRLALDGKLKLSGLTRDTAITPGGIVCTSGVGGIFPRGLIIGTVTEVVKEDGDISYCAKIDPAADIPRIADAFVITEFEGKADA